VRVTDGVKVTVGVEGLYPLKLKLIPTPLQKLPVGEGVGVTPNDDIVKLTSSQAILGVGVTGGT
jgi:hypothetical protein